MTSPSWLVDTRLSVTPTRPRRRFRLDRETTRASSDLAQMPNLGRHRLILPVRGFRHSGLRRRLGSYHYRTRSLVPSTYSTTALPISGHRRRPSPSTLTRVQQTFGCPRSAATAMVINSTQLVVQLSARLIRISPLPMWAVFFFLHTCIS